MSNPKTVTLQGKNAKNADAKVQECAAVAECCEQIRETAYYKWQAAGCPCGDGVDFWLEAEAEAEPTSGNRPSKPR